MDSMCDRLAAAKVAADVHMEAVYQLRHSDRISTLGRLASSVAHELGNPLNVIELRAQLITSGGSTNLLQAQQNAAVIVEQTRRMTHIIDEILSFARAQPARIRQLDLVDVLHKAVALSEHASHKHGTTLRVELPLGAIAIDGDADKLLQVFVNLMINGIEAMPHGGPLTLSTHRELRAPVDDPAGAPRRYVRVDVADRGVGILAEHLGKVFDAFFSTKSADGGTGLGLCIAQGIAHEHAGWIGADSEVGRGSTFRVYLPTRESPASEAHAAS
jgi:signal transduction histidine kinase